MWYYLAVGLIVVVLRAWRHRYCRTIVYRCRCEGEMRTKELQVNPQGISRWQLFFFFFFFCFFFFVMVMRCGMMSRNNGEKRKLMRFTSSAA